MSLHIGLDLDNTIVQYDELFYRCALERHLIPEETTRTKAAVRAYLWSLPHGNTPWTELQGIVYGERMSEAIPCPGALDFLAFCRDNGIRVSIVSHKIEFPALGPRVNLRKAALRWLNEHASYGGNQAGLTPGGVFFESTREDKIARIGQLGCTHFIDDLPEVFTSPSFPDGVEKILYAGNAYLEIADVRGMGVFSDWAAILQYFRGKR